MSAVATDAESVTPGETTTVAGRAPALRSSPDETPSTVVDNRPASHASEPTSSSVFSRLAPYALIFQALTGVILMFSYHPSAGTAYFDLVDLREASRLGFVRGLHFWGSHAAVIIAWLAVLQLGMRGVRRLQREWKIALAVMLLILALAATGHVLPGDDQAHGWLTGLLEPTIVTDDPPTPTEASGPIGLIGFYVMHCIVLPLGAAALVIGYRRKTRNTSIPAELPRLDD